MQNYFSSTYNSRTQNIPVYSSLDRVQSERAMQRFNTKSGFLVEEVESVFRNGLSSTCSMDDMLRSLFELFVSACIERQHEKCSHDKSAWSIIFQIAFTECAYKAPLLLHTLVNLYDQYCHSKENNQMWTHLATAAVLVRNGTASNTIHNCTVLHSCILGNQCQQSISIRAITLPMDNDIKDRFVCSMLNPSNDSKSSCKNARILSMILQDTICSLSYCLSENHDIISNHQQVLLQCARIMTILHHHYNDSVIDLQNGKSFIENLNQAIKFIEKVGFKIEFSDQTINRMISNPCCWFIMLLVNAIVHGIGSREISLCDMSKPEEEKLVKGTCANVLTLLDCMKMCARNLSHISYHALVLSILLVTTIENDLFMGQTRIMQSENVTNDQLIFIKNYAKKINRVQCLSDPSCNIKKWFNQRKKIAWFVLNQSLYPSCGRMCGKNTYESFAYCIQLVDLIQKSSSDQISEALFLEIEKDISRSCGNAIVIHDLNLYFSIFYGKELNAQCLSILCDNAKSHMAYASWLGMQYRFNDVCSKICLINNDETCNFNMREVQKRKIVTSHASSNSNVPIDMARFKTISNGREKIISGEVALDVLRKLGSVLTNSEDMVFEIKDASLTPSINRRVTTDIVQQILFGDEIVLTPFRMSEQRNVINWLCDAYRRSLFPYFEIGSQILIPRLRHCEQNSKLFGERCTSIIAPIEKSKWRTEKKEVLNKEYFLVQNYSKSKSAFDLLSSNPFNNTVIENELCIIVLKDIFVRILLKMESKALNHIFVANNIVYSTSFNAPAKGNMNFVERVKSDPHLGTSLFDGAVNHYVRTVVQTCLITNRDVLITWLKRIQEKMSIFHVFEREVFGQCGCNLVPESATNEFVVKQEDILERITQCIEIMENINMEALAQTINPKANSNSTKRKK